MLAELLPQARDVDVERALRPLALGVEHLLHEVGAGIAAPGRRARATSRSNSTRVRSRAPAVGLRAPAGEVDRQGAGPDPVLALEERAPQAGPHAGEQLFRPEGLRDVVVGPEPEVARTLSGVSVAGREDEHRDVGGLPCRRLL